jgi:hypothetical protein
MRRLSPWLLLTAAFPATLIAVSQRATSAPNLAVVATRLYTGSDGQSHIDQVPIALYGSHADLKQSEAPKMSDAYIVRAASRMFESWHNADRKRYIVVGSGEAEVTTTSGEKARIVPGQIYLAEDLTGKGHTFRVIGDKECVALFVNFAR